MIAINLLPGAARSKRSGGFSLSPALLGGIRDQFQNRYIIGGSAAAAAGLVAIGAMFALQTRAETTVQARAAAAARDSARYAVVLVARRKAETARDSVYQQLAIIKSIDDSRFTWPHVLEAINLALPQYTWLTAIQQTSAVTSSAAPAGDSASRNTPAPNAKKPTAAQRARMERLHSDSLFSGTANTIAFRIVGQTVDIQALTQFMKALEASPFIRNVQLTRSDLVTNDNKEVTEFQLEAQTSVPPRHVLEMVPLSIAVE